MAPLNPEVLAPFTGPCAALPGEACWQNHRQEQRQDAIENRKPQTRQFTDEETEPVWPHVNAQTAKIDERLFPLASILGVLGERAGASGRNGRGWKDGGLRSA